MKLDEKIVKEISQEINTSGEKIKEIRRLINIHLEVLRKFSGKRTTRELFEEFCKEVEETSLTREEFVFFNLAFGVLCINVLGAYIDFFKEREK